MTKKAFIAFSNYESTRCELVIYEIGKSAEVERIPLDFGNATRLGQDALDWALGHARHLRKK